jgi:hypothetical protein
MVRFQKFINTWQQVLDKFEDLDIRIYNSNGISRKPPRS